MFTLYTYVAPVLAELTHASDKFVTLSLVLIGVGFTIGNGIGGRLADWSLDGATTIFLAALALVMVTLPLALTSHLGAAIGLVRCIQELLDDSPWSPDLEDWLEEAGGFALAGLVVVGIGGLCRRARSVTVVPRDHPSIADFPASAA